MKRLEENPRLLRLFAWSGPFLVACWIAALVIYGRFIPPRSPGVSAATIQQFYLHHTTALRIDALVLMLTGGFWATWGAAIATFIKRMESGWLLTFATLALFGGGYVFFETVPLFWGVAAFRPGAIPATTTQTLHDLGWFAMLWTWPPFALLNVVLGVAILRDKSMPTVLPRWVAYLNLWCACVFAPAALVIFAKSGAISYAGVISLYIPLGVFFAWMCGVTIGVTQALRRDEQAWEQRQTPSVEAAVAVTQPASASA
jgi:hypothetical protein